MIRFYLRFALCPVFLFTAALLLIRAQPYDDRDPRAVLPPINCRVPCFMGIRPGVTTVDEAISLLRKHEWVSHVIALPNEERPVQIGWVWNEKAPDYLQKGGAYYDGEILRTRDNKVSRISFNTLLQMGDIPLILGNPKEDGIIMGAGIIIPPDPQIQIIVELWFTSYRLWITGIKSCPYYADFWRTPTRIVITDYDLRSAMRTTSIQIVPHTELLSTLRTLSLQVCGY